MMFGKKVLNGFLSLIEGMAILLGYKWRIKLDEHKIYPNFINPDNKARAYDRSHFVNGNIFLRGKASPIKPVKVDKDVSIIGSSRYKMLMRNKVIGDLIKSQEEEGWSTRKIMLVGVVLTAINTSAVGVLLLVIGGGA